MAKKSSKNKKEKSRSSSSTMEETLYFPASEASLFTEEKKNLKKIEKRTGTVLKLKIETDRAKDSSVASVVVNGNQKSCVEAHLQIRDLLAKSKKMQSHNCPPALVEFLLDWDDASNFEFQKNHDIFIDFDDLGGASLKAWKKTSIQSALNDLKDLITAKNDKELHEKEKLVNLSSSSDSDSDEENMTQSISFTVAGSPEFREKDIKKLAKKTNTVIEHAIEGKKRPRTVFTVTSDDKKGNESAVKELSKMFKHLNSSGSGSGDFVKVKASGKEKKKNHRMVVKSSSSEEDSSSDSSDSSDSSESSSESESENEDVYSEFASAKYPKHMNILVLGETGVGKSTFINGLVNYLKCRSIEEARQKGVEILIHSSFTLTDDNFQSQEIVNAPTIADEQGSKLNEHFGKGQSATQDPKSYIFKWTGADGDRSIRIIDTPGIGDTRGMDQDKKNFNKILSFLSDFSELHAVCILMKPNSARLTLAFRFCIDELLVHLHKSASKNILFCFTNTRGTLYRPGDTLPTLREHLDKLYKERDVKIPLDSDTLFSFDNESFRFLCAYEKGFPFSDTDIENFQASWTKSVQETLRLFARISHLPVHSVHETLSLNNTRNVILAMARPLAEIAKNQMINMKLIEDKMQEVEDHAKAGKDLKDQLYVDQVVIRVEEIDYPQTVCTAAECVEHRRFNPNDENSAVQTIYKTICHDHCYLTGVQVENCPNTALQNCWAMDGNKNCKFCKCPWSTHMHIRYKLHQTMEKVVDPTVQASIANKDDMVKTIELFLKSAKEEVDQLKKEHSKITQYCAEFAAFLAKNSILPYNDSYRQYMDHLIKEESEKVAAGGSDTLLNQMKDYKAEYEQQVSILDANMNVPASRSRGVSDINDMVRELKQLKHCGQVLTEIQKLELLKVRQKAANTGKVVALNSSSWFAVGKKLINKGKRAFGK